ARGARTWRVGRIAKGFEQQAQVDGLLAGVDAGAQTGRRRHAGPRQRALHRTRFAIAVDQYGDVTRTQRTHAAVTPAQEDATIARALQPFDDLGDARRFDPCLCVPLVPGARAAVLVGDAIRRQLPYLQARCGRAVHQQRTFGHAWRGMRVLVRDALLDERVLAREQRVHRRVDAAAGAL